MGLYQQHAKMKTGRRLLVATLILTILAIFIQADRSQRFMDLPDSTFGGIVLTLYTPLFKGVQTIKNFFVDIWTDYFYLVHVRSENIQLKQDLSLQKLYVQSLKERLRLSDQEDITRHKLITLGYEGVTARLTAYDPFSPSQTIWISAGSRDGVVMDQPVITFDGLVGRVLTVHPHTSQILLLVDQHFAVDVIDESSRIRALIVGGGPHANLERYPLLSHLEYLKMGNELMPGDLFVTSGLNGVYPPGIPVGNLINDVILPVVDFSKLEQVIVITRFGSPL